MHKRLATATFGLMLLLGGAAQANKPVENVSHHVHPNLAEAQRLCTEAFEKLGAAQRANGFDMQGHAARAKELLEQVNHEIKLAAEAANGR